MALIKLGYAPTVPGDSYGQNGWKVLQTLDCVAPSSGVLKKIYVYLPSGTESTAQCKLGVYAGTSTGATLLASATLTNPPPGGWAYVDVSAANVSIVQGQTYCACAVFDGSSWVGFDSGTVQDSFRELSSGPFTAVYANELTSTLQATSGSGGANRIALYSEYDEVAANPINITINNDTHGSTSPSGSTTFESGSATAISATANSGYHFVTWTVTSGSVTFGNANLASTTATITATATIQANFAQDAAKPRILCMGDSITADQVDWSYRKTLQDFLTVGKYDFVGPAQSPSDGIHDQDHSGSSGNVISEISTRLTSNLTTYMSSAPTGSTVTILAGTNDVNNDSNTSNYQGYVNAIGTMVDNINTFDSSITVLVGLIPPIDSAADSRVTTFNGLLTTLVNSKKATKSNLFLVDCNTPIKAVSNWQSVCMYDYLHPGTFGLSIMAFEWYKGVIGLSFTKYQISSDLRVDLVTTTRTRINSGSTNAALLLRLLNSSGQILSNHSLTLFGAPSNGVISATPSNDSSPVLSGIPAMFQILDRDRNLQYTALVDGAIKVNGNVVSGVAYNLTGDVYLSISTAE